jgi:catalase
LNDVIIQEHNDSNLSIRSIVTNILKGDKPSEKTVVEMMSDEDADEARKYFGVF